MVDQDHQRRAELVEGLAAVRTRLFEACSVAQRDVRSVTLIAVTKTYPAADAATLVELGVRDLGESRDQEAAAKVGQVRARLDLRDLDDGVPRWHFVGRLQSRKSRSVAGYATAVHSLDRVTLVADLAAAVARLDRRPLEIFVQVSLDGDPQRGGAAAADLLPLADETASRPELRLRGVMAVGPLGMDPDRAFAELEEISARLRTQHPTADAISAGMSTDLEQAVAHGATHVRVGSALLGLRSEVFG
ncbi:MAG: YggS family pyridoxal phosphate-dependent enzyme [Actinomycetota bacterium]|nr:YggS family pyridoxal phosphate-dependent enzyme [Actinomycetota bacterium]